MKRIINTLAKVAIFTLFCSHAAHAETTEKKFKIAKIDNYQLASMLENDRLKSLIVSFEQHNNLCIENLVNGEFALAKPDCNLAIKNIESMPLHDQHYKYLKALAYSNRAIVNYFMNEMTLAQADFTKAKRLKNNSVIRHNRAYFYSLANREAEQQETIAMLAD
ncbi:hypothetical protein [Thalassotalea sp. PLHSN55]|uniref:hypothetical protein n=1 Tax=Thalassotalea sp. PLHSN55 TaxID=3435888 RepID=UPI003F8594EF